MLIAGFLGILLGVTQPPVFESPIRPTCALTPGAFCIREAGMEIDSQVERTAIVYAGHTPEEPFILTWSSGCSAPADDEPRLVGYSPYARRNGAIYLDLIFRLNEACFLTLSARSRYDPRSTRSGLSLGLGLVTTCPDLPCSGSRLMDLVARRLRESWFAR